MRPALKTITKSLVFWETPENRFFCFLPPIGFEPIRHKVGAFWKLCVYQFHHSGIFQFLLELSSTFIWKHFKYTAYGWKSKDVFLSLKQRFKEEKMPWLSFIYHFFKKTFSGRLGLRSTGFLRMQIYNFFWALTDRV